MKKYIFPILIALSALALAGAAAFFSVTGLSKLFGGAKMEVIVMASALEFAKLVTASFLHRYWNVLKWQMKTYLTIGVMTVMIITSAGIYGFLSNAYSVTSGKLDNVDAQVTMVEQKKQILNSEITRIQENKTLKSDRVKSLITLRSKQEARIDSLYNRKQIVSAKRVEQQVEQANQEIITTNIEVDSLNNQTQRKYGEISAMELEILNLKNNDINSEVGPLRYISKLTGKDMDSVVNFFIMMLIFVFDPLAVSLVIATNISIEREFKKKEGSKEPESEPVKESIIESEKKIEPITEQIVVEEVKPEFEQIAEPIVVEEEIKKEPEFELIAEENAVEETKSEISAIEFKEELEAQEKTNQVISYVADESGEFKPAIKEEASEVVIDEKIMEQIRFQGIENNASYLRFLEVLYKGGLLKTGDNLPTWNIFLEQISAAGIQCTEKEVKNFLIICNLNKITDMSGAEKKIDKEYAVAKQIISLLSK